MIVPRKFLILQIIFFEFEARKNSSRSCSSDWGEPVTSFTVCSHHFQCVCNLNRFQMFGHSACELVRAFTSQGLKRCFGRWIDTLTGNITSNWPLNLKWVSNKWLDRVYLVDNALGNNYISLFWAKKPTPVSLWPKYSVVPYDEGTIIRNVRKLQTSKKMNKRTSLVPI